VRFWDSSAVVPLVVGEDTTERVRAAFAEDSSMLVWWGTPVECTSAVARRERDGALDAARAAEALDALRTLARTWFEMLPSDAIRATAQRLLRVHPLRAGDALQLAAAIIAAEHDPAALEFVGFDERLNDAAQREGFVVRALRV
jgi:predicted nucleic acid-binding protein